MSIEDVDLRRLLANVAGLFVGSIMADIFYKMIMKRVLVDKNITFSGAIMYANRMEE